MNSKTAGSWNVENADSVYLLYQTWSINSLFFALVGRTAANGAFFEEKQAGEVDGYKVRRNWCGDTSLRHVNK